MMLRRRAIEMLEQEPATRMGDDIEALHATRVATRRLRSILRLFEDALPEQAAALAEELRWLAGALGETRDLDVHLEQIGAWLATAGSQERVALEALQRLLQQDRLAARSRMLDALDSARYERLKINLVSLAALEQRLPRLAKKQAAVAMPQLIRRRYRRARRLADALSETSPPPDFHAVRIQCKRLRYALDCAEMLYGKPARAMIRRLADVQDILGRYQDAQVGVARMRDVCARHASDLAAETIAALDEIAQRHARQGDEIKQQFWPAWRRLRGPAWKKLVERMKV
jgi:CHAD domain-containing protein